MSNLNQKTSVFLMLLAQLLQFLLHVYKENYTFSVYG